MARQVYPVLLLIAAALGAAICMRPTIGEELMALASAGGQDAFSSHLSELSAPPLPGTEPVLQPLADPRGEPEAVAWPGTSASEAFVTDRLGDPPPARPTRQPPPGYYGSSWASHAPMQGDSMPSAGGWPLGSPTRQIVPQTPAAQYGNRVADGTAPEYAVAGGAWAGHQRAVAGPTEPTAGTAEPLRDPAPAGHYPIAGAVSFPPYSAQATPNGPPQPYGDEAPAAYPAHRAGGANAGDPGEGFPGEWAGPAAASGDPPTWPSNRDSVRSAPWRPRPDQALGPMAGVQSIPPEAQLAVPPAVVAEVKPCEGAQTLARVGNDLILASEVVPLVDETIAQLPESERAQIPDWQLEEERRALIMKLLRQQIEVKLVYQDARRNLPAERLEHIDKRLGEIFDKEELPKRIKKANVKSARELDERLQSVGTSLDRQKRAFVERMLAMQWMHEQNDFDEDVAHEEMVDYYWQHLDEFETPARALWEELSVCIPRYSDGAEAYAKLARLGNQVLDGAPMAEVLKAQPKECPECRGGSKGWITRGSAGLSEVLEEAIFGLPVGRPSRILRDRDGFHVVRVIQREDFQRTLFAEADQNEICEKIRRLRRQEQIQQYLFRLRQEITVSTVFDDDPAFAERPRASKPQRR